MTTVFIISIIIVIVVLVLSVLTTSKAYQFKHTIDSIDESQYPEHDNEKKREDV
ncbi:YtzI protein [Metabacillus fastidiosus]|uniref:YtzI protein n=1 Tax=Metabacillus fastidiosus TaxID=1458 RepID=UPI002DB9E8E5|nr:YtzI protein [Metabacillus fastidiosus]MEC2077807.1 YtzI protein [Metabacillus fastidiosus]